MTIREDWGDFPLLAHATALRTRTEESERLLTISIKKYEI
jgi:hypothetical protein